MRSYFLLFGVVCSLSSLLEKDAMAERTLKPKSKGQKTCEPKDYLGKQIDPIWFSETLAWDKDRFASEYRWQKANSVSPFWPSTRVFVLHFWADYCGPCRAEFHIYNTFQNNFPRQTIFGRTISTQFLFLAEQVTSQTMQQLLQDMRKMPQFGHFLDVGEAVQQRLAEQAKCTPLLPTTLVLNRTLVVQAALIGSIADRRNDLAEAIVDADQRPPKLQRLQARR